MTQEIATTSHQLTTTPRPNPFAMTTFAEVEKIAENISKAKAFGFKEPAQVVTAIFLAQDEGKTLAQLMREVHFHEDGKISNRADHLQARFEKEAGKIIWHVRTDETCCGTFILGFEITDEQRKRAEDRMDLMLDLDAATWSDPRSSEKELKLTKAIAKLNREGEVTVLRTLADADAKGISMGKNGQKNNWTTSSRAMLQWRCVTEAVNVVASHLRNGRSSDIDLFDLKAQEEKQRQRIVSATTISQDDVPSILEIIAQHDAELATDISDSRRKTVQGLRMDLVCRLGDLGIKPLTEPEAPKPTVNGQPATAVETVVLPPEQTAPKQPAARRQRAAATPTEPQATATTTTGTSQPPETPWREFICLRGAIPGSMNGHALGELFETGKRPPKNALELDKLVGWFVAQAIPTSSDSHDQTLWAKVQEAATELRAKFAQGTPTTPVSTQTTATTPEAPRTPAQPTQWRDFVIVSKSPAWDGKKLGTLTPEEVKSLKTEYVDKLDMARATLAQKSLVANVTMAMADMFPDNPEPDNHAGLPDHTAQLLDLIAQNKWDKGFFLTTLKMNKWVEEAHRTVEMITEDEFEALAREWAEVESAVNKAHQPAQQP